MLGAVKPEVTQQRHKPIADGEVRLEAVGGKQTRKGGNELYDFTGGQLEGGTRFSMEMVERGRGEGSYHCVHLLLLLGLAEVPDGRDTLEEIIQVDVVERGVPRKDFGDGNPGFKDLGGKVSVMGLQDLWKEPGYYRGHDCMIILGDSLAAHLIVNLQHTFEVRLARNNCQLCQPTKDLRIDCGINFVESLHKNALSQGNHL